MPTIVVFRIGLYTCRTFGEQLANFNKLYCVEPESKAAFLMQIIYRSAVFTASRKKIVNELSHFEENLKLLAYNSRRIKRA